jgi:hypothetical protein
MFKITIFTFHFSLFLLSKCFLYIASTDRTGPVNLEPFLAAFRMEVMGFVARKLNYQ